MERANFVAFACGKRGSGKSFLLDRLSEKFPRRIIIDPLGEYLGRYEGAQECGSLTETLDALEVNIYNGGVRRWTVVSCIEPNDTGQLCGALAPVGNMAGGYSRAVGGVCLVCGEVDTIAPNSAAIPSAVRNVLQRGRHYRVSFLGGTQRPRDVHRVVTSQADALFIFRQHELRDLDYIARITSGPLAQVVRELPIYTHARYLPNTGDCAIIDKNGRATRRVNVFDGSSDIQSDLPLLADDTDNETDNAESDN